MRYSEHEDAEIGACWSCNAEGVPVRPYNLNIASSGPSATKDQEQNLCQFCSHTFTSKAQQYPRQYEGEKDTMQLVANLANVIVEAADLREDVERYYDDLDKVVDERVITEE